MIDNNDIQFLRIGSGAFGTIYISTATPDVYKKCRSPNNCTILAEEYRQLKIISETLLASGNTILSPAPVEFYAHGDEEFWNDPTIVFPQDDATRTCAYSMTRVYPLPSAVKAKLIDLFCPAHLVQGKNRAFIRKGHHIARLLLGRADPDSNRVAPQRFFNTYNFSLTPGRLEQLGINTVELSGEMGRMLAQLHMTARNDARDVEVVLGADTISTIPSTRRREPRVWVIDFNQVKEFNFTKDQIPLLVDGFFSNEAYFPRARPNDYLYKFFAEAYIQECNKIGEVAGQLGQIFIAALEAEQARRDANTRTSSVIEIIC